MFLAAAMVASFASSALAGVKTETGNGKNGTPRYPADPTQGYTNQLAAAPVPVFLGYDVNQSSESGGLAIAIGNEGAANSVGRGSISGNSSGTIKIYAEDYTDGNKIAEATNTVNTTTQCNMMPCPPGSADDDAVLITITPSP